MEWLARQPTAVMALLLLANGALESLCPPHPADIILLLAAFLAGRGQHGFSAVYLSSCAGSVAGILLLYAAARRWGPRMVGFLSRLPIARFFPRRMLAAAQRRFQDRGDIVVLLSRFLPGMRAAVCFNAGLVRMPFRRFFAYSTASVLAWNAFMVVAGYSVGRTWDSAAAFLRAYSGAAVLVLLAGLTVVTVIYFTRRKRR